MPNTDRGTDIMIGNHIARARYNYSMIQEKVFNYVLKYCQRYMQNAATGVNQLRIDLFDSGNTDKIQIPLPLNEFAIAQDYPHVRTAVERMMSVPVSYHIYVNNKPTWRVLTRIFDKVISSPLGGKRQNYLVCEIDINVAREILAIDCSVNKNGALVMCNFTKYKYEIATSFVNKYAPRFYKLLSSWQGKGVCVMSIEDLKLYLGIPIHKYKKLESFKRCVLKPVQEELSQDAPLWFQMEDESFDIYEDNKIIGFRMTIYSIKPSVNYETDKIRLIKALRIDYQLTEQSLKRIIHIFDNHQMVIGVMDILDYKIRPKIQQRKIKSNLQGYVVTSILEKYPPAKTGS